MDRTGATIDNNQVNSLFDNLFRHYQDGIIVTEQDLSILYFNREMSAFSNSSIKVGELVFMKFPVLSSYDTEIKSIVNKCQENITIDLPQEGYSFSVCCIEQDNSELLLFTFRKVEGKNSKPNKSIFKPLVHQSPIATAIFNPEGKPLYINSAYGDLFSIPKEYGSYVLENYNILQDEQLIEAGLIPFIEKAVAGEQVDLPTVAYNPLKTSFFESIASDIDKHVKGTIFPVKDEKGRVNEIVIALNDVTFQKQAEQILTDAHLKFQMLNLNLPGAIYEYEIIKGEDKGNFIYMSQGCQEIFNLSPQEVMRDEEKLNDLIHPEDKDEFNARYYFTHRNTRKRNWVGRIIVEDKVKWVEVKSSIQTHPDGKCISYGVIFDITEKKEAELKYRKIEERLSLAIRSTEINIWEWEDGKGKIMFNNIWAKRLGFENELSGTIDEWLSLIHPEDYEEAKNVYNKLLKGNITDFDIQYRLKLKGGDWSWITDKGRIIEKLDNGLPKKIVGTQTDINEQKLSEAIIKKNEQLFTQLFENAPLGIVLLDENHKVVQMNEGFQTLFGYESKEIIGNALNNLIVPDSFLDEAHDINVMTGDGDVGMIESFRVRKDGKHVPVLIYGVPVRLNKKTIGIYGIYVDISDRKKTERELQIRNDELDNFVYKVSHDLRAPLSSILGLVNLANLHDNQDDPKQYIDLIGTRVRQLDTFISDVLSHSKNLKLAIVTEKIDFDSIIENCLNDLNYLPGADKVEVKKEISGIDFYSDPWRINEIFRNLISNAIKYIDPTKSKPKVNILIKTSKDHSVIKIQDNGLGIDKSYQGRIFEMFFRATTISEGSGIGLYIVKNAVEKLDGTIKVVSEPQKGTTFELIISNNKLLK